LRLSKEIACFLVESGKITPITSSQHSENKEIRGRKFAYNGLHLARDIPSTNVSRYKSNNKKATI